MREAEEVAAGMARRDVRAQRLHAASREVVRRDDDEKRNHVELEAPAGVGCRRHETERSGEQRKAGDDGRLPPEAVHDGASGNDDRHAEGGRDRAEQPNSRCADVVRVDGIKVQRSVIQRSAGNRSQ